MNLKYSEHKKGYQYLMIGVLFLYFGFSHDASNFIPVYFKFGSGIVLIIMALIEFWRTHRSKNHSDPDA